jgi:hypothetical protein
MPVESHFLDMKEISYGGSVMMAEMELEGICFMPSRQSRLWTWLSSKVLLFDKLFTSEIFLWFDFRVREKGAKKISFLSKVKNKSEKVN